MDSKILLWIATGITFLAKSLMAFSIPLTGDEAYFYTWGTFVDIGFYDHPPMVGWLLAIILNFSSSEYALRLPTLIFPYIIGAIIYGLVQNLDKNLARWTVILFFVSPINMMNVLVTSDTPLILFVSLSAACFYRGLHKNKLLYLILAGVFLGGAFLSKYFSVLLIIAYGIYVLIYQRNRRGLTALAIIIIYAIPFGFLNLYYNYTHGWSNIMFNVYNRNQGIGVFKPEYFLFYLGKLMLLITPFVIYFLLRPAKMVMQFIGYEHLRQYYSVLFYVPLAIFTLLSFTKSIGLHWILSFVPFLFILTFFRFDEETFRKTTLFVAIFTFSFSGLIAYISISPPEKLTQNRAYQQNLIYFKPQIVADILKPYVKDYILTTESYSKSAVLSYYTDNYVSVFGQGTYHARQDDMHTDFRHFDKKNLIIVCTKPADKDKYIPYFQEVDIQEIRVDNSLLYLVQGKGFKYDSYHELVLRPIKDNFYKIPSWLPMKGNYFSDKYFAGE